MRRFSLVLVCAAACGKVSAPTPGDDDDGDGGTPSLTMTVAGGRQFVRQGGMLSVEVGITRQGVTGAVDVTAQLPLGVTADPLTIDDGATTGMLVVHADPAAPFARTQVGVSGALGAVTASSTLDLDVIGTPGTLDPTFGSTGTATFTVASATSVSGIFAMAQGDAIVAAMRVTRATSNGIAVVRFAHDGTIDPSFGDAGQIFIDVSAIGLTSLENCAGGVQSDGKIVLAGGGSNGVDRDPFIVRLTSDGQLDASLPLHRLDTSSTDDSLYGMAIGPDDAIVLAGTRTTGSQKADALLIRTDASGVRDPAFGTNGIATFHDEDDTQFVNAAIQPDGRIVVIEMTVVTGGFFGTYSLRRFGTDGKLDAGFGVSGAAALATPSGGTNAARLAVTGGDLVVTGGMRTTGFSGSDDAMWRYLAGGALDTTFGGGTGFYGPVTADIDSLGPFAMDSSAGYYIAGGSETQSFGTVTLHLVHLDAAGVPDAGFGVQGDVADPIALVASSIVLRIDHRLVVMGVSSGLQGATAETFRAYWY